MALSVTLGFHAQFTASKVGKTGLTPTIDIKSVKKSDGTIASVVTGGSTTENWRGVYFYRLTGADVETYDYEAVFITSDSTVDQKEVPALWVQYSAAVLTASGHVSNVDTLTTYTGNTPQTGDAFARLGAPAGVSIAADIAEIEAETDGIAAIPTNPLLASSYTAPDNANIVVAATQATAAASSAAAVQAKLPVHNIADETILLAAIGTPIQTGGSIVITGYASGQDPATLVLDPAASGHNIAGSIGAKINSAAGQSGPGASACILEFVYNSVPAINAQVWLTSDQAGTNVIAGTLYTNADGKVTFMLTVGVVYYIWFVCPGFNSIQGQPYTAVAG